MTLKIPILGDWLKRLAHNRAEAYNRALQKNQRKGLPVDFVSCLIEFLPLVWRDVRTLVGQVARDHLSKIRTDPLGYWRYFWERIGEKPLRILNDWFWFIPMGYAIFYTVALIPISTLLTGSASDVVNEPRIFPNVLIALPAFYLVRNSTERSLFINATMYAFTLGLATRIFDLRIDCLWDVIITGITIIWTFAAHLSHWRRQRRRTTVLLIIPAAANLLYIQHYRPLTTPLDYYNTYLSVRTYFIVAYIGLPLFIVSQAVPFDGLKKVMILVPGLNLAISILKQIAFFQQVYWSDYLAIAFLGAVGASWIDEDLKETETFRAPARAPAPAPTPAPATRAQARAPALVLPRTSISNPFSSSPWSSSFSIRHPL